MMQAVVAVIALVAGAVLGFLFRSSSAKSERSIFDKTAAELDSVRAECEKAKTEAAAGAGFEKLAQERQVTIDRLIAERDAARQQVQLSEETARTHAALISQLEAELRGERQSITEKLALLETAKQALANQFEVLAGEVLEKKSKLLSEGSRTELDGLIAPLRDQLKDFREKVEKVQVESTSGVTELKTLIGNLGNLNQALTEEARNLTTALRGSAKAQGDWGEFILRDLLDKAGLREGEQYEFQQSFTGVEGEEGERKRTVRTDVIISLPGGRSLIIDSKVSLVAYTDCVAAQDEETRKAALKAHLASVRGHITGLAKAGYHDLPGIEAPDFVVMFVPVEPALLMALQADADVWADAYKRGILLVGPTTLLYVIRIVNMLWKQEMQARNVREVMDRGTALYEKFVGFVTDMEMIGDSLRKTSDNYGRAMDKLETGRGNLIRQVEMLKKLGLRTNKSIPKNLLNRAGVDQQELALAAEAEDETTSDK
ncbi:MAG: DNA recombination protein RmuC [Terracidiphilus sp.]